MLEMTPIEKWTYCLQPVPLQSGTGSNLSASAVAPRPPVSGPGSGCRVVCGGIAFTPQARGGNENWPFVGPGGPFTPQARGGNARAYEHDNVNTFTPQARGGKEIYHNGILKLSVHPRGARWQCFTVTSCNRDFRSPHGRAVLTLQCSLAFTLQVCQNAFFGFGNGLQNLPAACRAIVGQDDHPVEQADGQVLEFAIIANDLPAVGPTTSRPISPRAWGDTDTGYRALLASMHFSTGVGGVRDI